MTEKIYSHFKMNPLVCTDTRSIKAGSIFFALKGGNFNGNAFARQALERGCSLAVIDEEEYLPAQDDERYILVKDVLSSLQDLANHHRKELGLPVIAITGSNGKTTTKELVNAVLGRKYKVLATEGNLNNHIGVPLTLLSITKDHEMAIIEMGANHQGEIEMLSKIAEPDFGIITNIGKAHLEGFGGIEGVKKGKGELYRYIREKKGRLFVHGDDEVLIELAGSTDKVTYGTKKLYDVVGSLKTGASEFISFQWATRYNAVNVKSSELVNSQLVGVYNYYNLLCAACVGNYFKIEDSEINKALAEYTPSNNRSQLQKTEHNTLILDYYNANPSSMSLALDNFAALDHSNKIAILGDMLELGDESSREHDAIIDQLKARNIDNAYLVGPLFTEAGKKANIKTFPTSDELFEYLKANTPKHTTILIKGSRGIKLEKVIPAL
ncbi:MAG TPA: UDP-N-acetylmuramoyl-tripeptide--D-alanyl-D-alanine ligase [Bacteroidia bacterium]|jgi:UDP-N-acetylmuramoyl-tripeptide--D-alanyl-D-alanine ligase